MSATGEIDMSTAPKLGRALLHAAAPSRPLIGDLTGIEFMDSSGVHTLLKCSRDTAAHGTHLLIVPSPPVARVLTLAGAEQVLSVHPLLCDALTAARSDAVPQAATPQRAQRPFPR